MWRFSPIAASKRPEVYRLAGGSYLSASADREGWRTAETMRVRLRQAPGSNTLVVEDVDNPQDRFEI